MTPPLFLVSPTALAGDLIVLDGDEGRHAADVRRLRSGERIDVADGEGHVAHGVVAEVSRGRVVVDVEGRSDVPRPDPAYVVVQALAKGGRDEDAVEMMTEAGVDEIAGWQSSRSVARWTDRTAERWRSTTRAAAKQSRRAWVPTVHGPWSTADLCARIAAADVAVVLHESATRPLTDVELPSTGTVLAVVGPEGGISDEELEQLCGAGAVCCRLGSTVLRSSTAGVAAVSVLSARQRWR